MTFHSFQSHAARVLRGPSPLAPRPARPPPQHRLCSPHSSAHKGLLGGSPPPGRPTSSTQASVLSSLQEPSLSTPWVPIALPPQGVVSPPLLSPVATSPFTFHWWFPHVHRYSAHRQEKRKKDNRNLRRLRFQGTGRMWYFVVLHWQQTRIFQLPRVVSLAPDPYIQVPLIPIEVSGSTHRPPKGLTGSSPAVILRLVPLGLRAASDGLMRFCFGATRLAAPARPLLPLLHWAPFSLPRVGSPACTVPGVSLQDSASQRLLAELWGPTPEGPPALWEAVFCSRPPTPDPHLKRFQAPTGPQTP